MLRKSGMVMLALALAACQPLPHPFEDDRPAPHAPILTVPDTVGVVVEPLAGAPGGSGGALAQSMVDAFQALEVPASTGPGNKSSFHLAGDASASAEGAGGVALKIRWSLRSADGKEVGSDLEQGTIPAGSWANGSGPEVAALAKAEAPKLSAFIVEPEVAEHKPLHQVFVRKAEGAPGNGATALSGALAYLLKQHAVEVTPDPQASDTIAVMATVTVTAAAKPDQQHVEVAWHVLKPDGSEIGQITQENDVPQGTLDGQWGDVAMAIASAAVDDIVKVIGLAPAPT